MFKFYKKREKFVVSSQNETKDILTLKYVSLTYTEKYFSSCLLLFLPLSGTVELTPSLLPLFKSSMSWKITLFSWVKMNLHSIEFFVCCNPSQKKIFCECFSTLWNCGHLLSGWCFHLNSSIFHFFPLFDNNTQSREERTLSISTLQDWNKFRPLIKVSNRSIYHEKVECPPKPGFWIKNV